MLSFLKLSIATGYFATQGMSQEIPAFARPEPTACRKIVAIAQILTLDNAYQIAELDTYCGNEITERVADLEYAYGAYNKFSQFANPDYEASVILHEDSCKQLSELVNSGRQQEYLESFGTPEYLTTLKVVAHACKMETIHDNNNFGDVLSRYKEITCTG